MILSRVIFPNTKIVSTTELYLKGNYVQQEDHILVNPKNTLSFCTYFNSFTSKKWYRYSFAENASLRLSLSGEGKVILYNLFYEGDALKTSVLHEESFKCSFRKEIEIPFDLKNTEIVYFEILNEGNSPIYLFDGAYCCDADEKNVNEVRLAIGICTFKREEFVIANIERMSSYFSNSESPLYSKVDVFVSDNGSTLDLDTLNSGFIHVVHNLNYGGAGGFGRTMIEAIKLSHQKEFTHFIFMDDDIILDPRAIEKTFFLLRVLKPEFQNHAIGGAMFSMEDMYLQFENGASWINKNFKFNLRDLDLRYRDNIALNEADRNINYNAWCYSCYPFSYIRSNNLPLPIFFHMDDIEFCLRNKTPIITLNGINVWHLYNNKGLINAKNQYYDVRNKLIMLAELDPDRLLTYVQGWLSFALNEAFAYRYGSAMNTYQAIIDFCKGLDFLGKGTTSEIHSKLLNDGKWRDATPEEIEQAHVSHNDMVNSAEFKKALLKQTIFGKKKDFNVTMYKNKACDAIYYNKVIVIDPKTKKANEYCRDVKMLIRVLFKRHKTRKMLDKHFNDAVASYHNRINELQTLDYWNKYLELPVEKDKAKKINVCFCASDNSVSSGAFNSMVVLASLLRERHNVNPLILLPQDGNGIDLVKKFNLPFVIINSSDWIVKDDASEIDIENKIARYKEINVLNRKEYIDLFKRHNIDIIHVNTSYHFASIEPALKSHIKVIWHLREFLEEDQNKMFADKEYAFKLLNQADRVIAISNSIFDKYSSKIGKLSMVYNGIDTTRFYKPEKQIFEDETIKILCVGAIAEYKGQHLIVEALCKLRDEGFNNFELTLAGTFGGTYYDSLINQLNEHGIRNKVKFLGVVQNTDELYNEADVLFVGSKSEAFGRITVEGMMSGCLVLGANTAGTKEIVNDGDTGILFESGDSDSVVEKLKEIIDNKESSKEIAVRGRESSIVRFNAIENADNVYDIYKEVLK